MSKLRVGLLSLVVLVQGLTILGGIIAYHQMSERYTRLQEHIPELVYQLLVERVPVPPEVFRGEWDWQPDPPNPFLPLLLLALFGASLTTVLLVDEVRQK